MNCSELAQNRDGHYNLLTLQSSIQAQRTKTVMIQACAVFAVLYNSKASSTGTSESGVFRAFVASGECELSADVFLFIGPNQGVCIQCLLSTNFRQNLDKCEENAATAFTCHLVDDLEDQICRSSCSKQSKVEKLLQKSSHVFKTHKKHPFDLELGHMA